MTVSDYLAWLLTGERVGDQSTASLTGIWQPHAADWWAEGLDAAGVTRERLSVLRPPGTPVARTCAAAQQSLGLPAGIPFAVGALDHVAAAYGAGIGAISPCCDSTGTVIAIVYLTASYDPSPDYCVGPAAGGLFCKLAYHANGASLLEWHQKKSAPERGVGDLLEGAFADGIAPPLPGVEVSEDSARRVRFSGELPHHGLAHRTRALVEMLTANLAELVGRVGPEGGLPCILATGGGARSPEWLQLKADTIGVPFVTVQNPEPACFGAALFASAAAGWYPDVADASAALVRVAARYEPRKGRR
jgi:sugar (pentulose or hexulose) kinase